MRLFHQPTDNACAGFLESAEGIVSSVAVLILGAVLQVLN